MVPYGAVLYTRGRGERGGHRVLARGEYDVGERRCGRSKFVEQRIDFWATPERPFEHPVGGNSVDNSSSKIDRAGRDERSCFRVL